MDLPPQQQSQAERYAAFAPAKDPFHKKGCLPAAGYPPCVVFSVVRQNEYTHIHMMGLFWTFRLIHIGRALLHIQQA